ncbi:SWIM zinc finger family protein [Beggiatoa leptomitoformis]|uniref:SWIM zinc finger family protein n=1 Tax=Beggiatoa leptomitoformis TaxID=288004 RepID=A0A2N9YDH0_9GAMM|nr:SWIM zinc finger family protein [Beggiatoa leptomitoformis]ALG69163.1 SWIM zinc finger family protein [Beggiatoa leptomitoformis]AUI68415.1 SWIM zinc finger family protein [Beggiatoa leptomitoformis]
MSTNYTTEQILQLAPDEASKKSGKGLAKATHWVTLGYSDSAIWGECQGSGSKPYQTRIDLDNMAFKCSCPSRKFPCKHALGLFLLYAQNINVLTKTDDPPDWVAEWLAGRATKQAKQSQPKAPVNEAAQAKRAEKRENTVQAGLTDISLWLNDIIRTGLADLKNRPYHFFEQMAARMVDAQAMGVARYLQLFASTVNSSDSNWSSQLLADMAKLHLLIESYQHLDQLDPTLQSDIRALIGWTQKKENLLEERPAVRDNWFVCGQYMDSQSQLVTQRIWLYGETSQQFALLLTSAHPSNLIALDRQWLTGTTVDADLVFYPSVYPLRAILKARYSHADSKPLLGLNSIAAVYQVFQTAIMQQCWITQLPIIIENVRLHGNTEQGWGLQDTTQHYVNLSPTFTEIWHLLAIGAGKPMKLFGEYSEAGFLPLGIWHTDGYQYFNVSLNS